jgi:hypothetical protein
LKNKGKGFKPFLLMKGITMEKLDYEIEILFNGVRATLNRKKWNELVDLITDGDRIEIVTVKY